LFDAFMRTRCLAGHQSPVLEQAVLADFITEGHFARHVRRMRALYAERQQTLLKAGLSELNDLLEIEPSEAGMHLIGWLPEGVERQERLSHCLAAFKNQRMKNTRAAINTPIIGMA
jgi:GntR family transcriptional regulator/MocR family aminotransferase